MPALMQDAQTCIRLRFPDTTACTVWMFGSQRRFVRRCEWLSCLEKYGDFPQISHVADMPTMVPGPLGPAGTRWDPLGSAGNEIERRRIGL